MTVPLTIEVVANFYRFFKKIGVKTVPFHAHVLEVATVTKLGVTNVSNAD